jgi:hypothetical protein
LPLLPSCTPGYWAPGNRTFGDFEMKSHTDCSRLVNISVTHRFTRSLGAVKHATRVMVVSSFEEADSFRIQMNKEPFNSLGEIRQEWLFYSSD